MYVEERYYSCELAQLEYSRAKLVIALFFLIILLLVCLCTETKAWSVNLVSSQCLTVNHLARADSELGHISHKPSLAISLFASWEDIS